MRELLGIFIIPAGVLAILLSSVKEVEDFHIGIADGGVYGFEVCVVFVPHICNHFDDVAVPLCDSPEPEVGYAVFEEVEG